MIEIKMICDICGMEGHVSAGPSMDCIKALKAKIAWQASPLSQMAHNMQNQWPGK